MKKTIFLTICAVLLGLAMSSCQKPRQDKYNEPFIFSGEVSEGDMIDLGLSVLWGSTNIGADIPTDFGHFFSWGKLHQFTTLDELRNYDKGSYTTAGGTLKADDDVAAQLFGYRYPSPAEFKELIENCEWLYVRFDDVIGYVVKGPNGNSIFMPCANYYDWRGYADAWPSGLYFSNTIDSADTSYATAMSFRHDRIDTGRAHRYLACPVRPVADKTN